MENYMYGNIQEDEYVLVETVSMFRIRYVVPTPKCHDEWALDTVVMNEAKEFSQKHLDETIVSHRRMTKEEALRLCDEDNEYAKEWSDEKKLKVFFTSRILEDGTLEKNE